MATPRFTIMRVQRPRGELDEAPWRNIDQNFEALKDALERAITAGTLLSMAQRQLVGDVTGYIGDDQTTTVEKIRNVTIPAPAAGDDGKAITYNHSGVAFTYTDKLTDVFTTRGDLLYRGASAEARLALGAQHTILKSDGTDPAWATLSATLDTISSTQGVVLYRGAATWAALGTSTSGYVLKTQGAGANPTWAAMAFTQLSDAPSSYTSQALKALRVNAGATAVEFFTQAFTLLSDVPSAYTGHGGKVVKVKGDESGLEFVSGGGGVVNFVDLGDVPANYSGAGSKFVKVNAGATGLEFVSASSSSPLTTKGDLFTFTTVDARLAIGANYKILQADSAETTGLKWVDLSEALDDALGNTQGNILYRGGSGWTVLAPSTAGYLLQTGGAGANPSWTAPGGAHNLLSVTHSDTTAASVVRGDIITGQTGPVWARKAIGTRRYTLSNDGTDIVWDDPKRFEFSRYYSALWAVLSTFNNIAPNSAGAMGVTEFGTRADGGDTARPSNKWTNGTTTAVGIRCASNTCPSTWYPYFRAGVKIVDNVDGVTWIGLLNTTTPPTTDDPAVQGAFFRAANTTDTTFQACLHDGATLNNQNTGVNIDGNWHEFEINTPDGGTNWDFYIDGVLTNSLTTNHPTTSQVLCGHVSMGAKSSSAREIRISHASILCNTRPTV